MSKWSIERDEVFGCDVFTGPLDRDGYGLIWRGKRPSSAHKVAYEREHGEVPEGMVLDHECCNRRCVRVVHLRPVTQQENLWRRRWAYRSRIAQCKNGHDMRLEAMVTSGGGRVCRTCSRSDEA